MAAASKHWLVVLAGALAVSVAAVAAAALLGSHEEDGGAGAAGCAPGDRGVVKAYLCVAARKAWEEIIMGFERNTCIKVEAVYGSSGSLLARLQALRDADVYAPASPVYMERAIELGLVDPGSVREAAYLVPAILVPAGNPAGIRSIWDLARPGLRVGLGDPESVAVGRYAREMLERLGLWEAVSRNAVYASSFSQLVGMVASGSVDAAIGWSVAEAWVPGRVEAIPLPPNVTLGPSPVPMAVTLFSKNRGAAGLFIDYAAGPAAAEAWRRAGYLPASAAGLAEPVEEPAGDRQG